MARWKTVKVAHRPGMPGIYLKKKKEQQEMGHPCLFLTRGSEQEGTGPKFVFLCRHRLPSPQVPVKEAFAYYQGASI